MLEDMISNKNIIRVNGRQYTDDRELSENEKEALRQIVPIYKAYEEYLDLND
ncbi:hypothetical protein P7H60_12265 [Vagococcus carniphilus]|uniref:hypothetical protein n=1 Tax=Vagococcus carniphilus TaxID=218144 RepID=UPI0028910486|nr:hypothetical protein [Vagococcus carniphilus]MDT2849918.1 hypothetical protein [Vagococcus carniphilus]